MKVPLRIIGIATSAFWIILIIFCASVVYSMKDVRVNLGQEQTSTTEDHELQLSFPMSIVNPGLYKITDLNFSKNILDNEGSTIVEGFIHIPVIGQGQTMNFTKSVKLNVTDLLQTHQSLLNDDTNLITITRLSMLVAGVIPLQASMNSSLTWGAPLYNLTVGTPRSAMFNATHSLVTVPLSFENHAFFNLTGTIWLRAFSTTGELIGQGQTDINVVEHSPCNENLEVHVPLGAVSIVRFEVFFATAFFSYRLEVAPHGG